MSVVYRDRDREYDSRTTLSSGRRDGGYTTVKRYIVKDDDARSNVTRGDRRSFVPERPGERVEETRIVRRERESDEPVREMRREEPRYSTSELVIRRDKEDDRRDFYYDRRRPEESADRELIIRRTTERDEPRRDDYNMTRYDDRRDYRVSEPRYRDDLPFDDRDRDLQRYSRSTEYFAPAPQPQTIIIKQEPIVIRERVRDDEYQIVKKSDIEEEKSIVRREPSPQREEDYFYEKKVRERIDGPRRDRSREDDWRERRSMRREVSPHDSVSQAGRRDYSSDDSMVYVRRTKEDSYSRESSPHNKRNLAAGVVAGIGAAELLRNHKKKEGREASHGVGRVGRDIGAGALGAIAAEGISRARSRYRSKSRRRSDSRSSSGRRRSRSRSRRRSRSRSESPSKLKKLGAVGLGAVALAGIAAVASKRMGKNKEEVSPSRGRSRSRSRHRHESVAEIANDPDAPSSDPRNPRHRNIRMAEAGAAGAAITALIDRARSKSRGRDRSRSRIRQAVPVVAAGLGSAALAGLYEKNKAKKEAEVIKADERKVRQASRSRSRARSDYYDGPRDASLHDPAMIEYGDGPMHGNNFGPDYYGRPAPQEGYYANQTAVVPAAAAAAAPAAYGQAREARSRSRSFSRDRRSRSRSSSISPGGHRRRRHRSREASAGAATAGGPAAAATSEHERRKHERRERRARRREQEQYGRDPYEEAYNPQYVSPQQDPYAAYSQTGYAPQGASQFPPPPGAQPYQEPVGAPQAAPYDPHNFPPPPPPPGGAPGAPGYDAYASGANPYAPRRGADENVSAPPNLSVPDGLNNARGPPGFSPTPPAATHNAPPPPSINIQPPASSSTPFPNPPHSAELNVPLSGGAFVPPTELGSTPTESRPRAASQPPPSGPRKSVQFAEKPEVSEAVPTETSEATLPDGESRHRHRSRRERGYEAGDDTDSTPDDMRRRQRANGEATNRGLDPNAADEGKRRHHRRRRSHDASSSRSYAGPSSSGSSSRRDREREDRPTSPGNDSDATVELPARFDEKGRKKAEPSDDLVADKIDEILSGKGTAGKMFGNFMGGLFGPDGRKKGKDR